MRTPIEHEKLLDALLTAIVVLDKKLSISYLNLAAENLLSLSGERLQGQAFSYFFDENDETPASLLKALEESESFTKRRAHWRMRSGQELYVDFSVTPDPELDQVFVEIQPLDRILKISREEEWASSHETASHIVRSMAHEIKNPLGGIRGAAQLLDRELVDTELSEYTRIIIGETDRLTNLTNRMLGPTEPVRHRMVNIHEVLEHVCSILKLEAPRSVRLVKDYDPSIPEMFADKEQLIQAIMNIVRNAMQALTENEVDDARIVVKTRVQRRYTVGRKTHPLVAQISIIDNGPGVPEEMIKSIFYPMITGRASGTGLGLAIAQNLIHRHQGFIECNSVPGRTEFLIYIPLGISHAQNQ